MAKAAFLFPGQGSQTVGMARESCEKIPAAKRLFDTAADILEYDLYSICANGPAEKLDTTEISQPAIFVASLAALEKLRAEDESVEGRCAATAGLSLGEYTALVFAGAMTFEDALKVVKRRGEAMQQAADAQPTAMVSVLGMDDDEVTQLCTEASSAGKIQIANYLCPNNIVVSGSKSACDTLEELALAKGNKTVRLAVAGAFHTDFMKPADEKVQEALRNTTIRTPRIPVWSNVDAGSHTDPTEFAPLLVRQVLQPVLWEKTMRNMLADGIDEFYEIGPKRVLAGLLKRVDRKIKCQNVQP